MFVLNSKWEKIRDQFTEEEKAVMREHVTGSVICPPGNVLDSETLPLDLKEKLIKAMEKAR